MQHNKTAHLGALMGSGNFFNIFLVLWGFHRIWYDFFFQFQEKIFHHACKGQEIM